VQKNQIKRKSAENAKISVLEVTEIFKEIRRQTGGLSETIYDDMQESDSRYPTYIIHEKPSNL